MYRTPSALLARRTAGAATLAASSPSSPHLYSARPYTPIYDPAILPGEAARRQRVVVQRQEDERRTLWLDEGRTAAHDLPSAVRTWLRLGNDPLVHTAALTPNYYQPRGDEAKEQDKHKANTKRAAPPHHKTSPFHYVEDYMGTHLLRSADAPTHVHESVQLWSNYYMQYYAARLRQARRTAANFVGPVNAPETFTDEADVPNTKWARDTYFSELAYLLERHAKEKVGNLLQLEQTLAEKVDAEHYLLFFQHALMQPAVHTRIPLPAPALWFFEGDRQKQWVERYLPVSRDAIAFFRDVLAKDVQAQQQQPVLAAVAAAAGEVFAILSRRAERQTKAGLRPTFAEGDHNAAALAAQEQWCAHLVELEQRAMHEGVFDPENALDPSPEWKAEHAELQAVLDTPVKGCGFTLQSFWLHTWRREALETAHVLEEPHLRAVAAAARARLYRETAGGALAPVLQELQAAIAKGHLDLRAATFRPAFNATLAKWQYAKYGGSATVQHLHTAQRQLWYHHLATPQEIAATANLYYATKPGSSQLDYTSPYTYRQSLLAVCAAYGLDRMYATQQPTLTSAARLAAAEEQIAAVVRAVAAPIGRRRRARQAAARAAAQRLLQPITNVRVTAPPAELLPTGAPDSAVTTTPAQAAAAVKQPITMWPLGSRQAVHYTWEVPQLERLRRASQSGPLTAAKLQELQRLADVGHSRLELSLWRKVSAEEKKRARAATAATAQQLQTLVAATPELAEVQQYAANTFELLSQETAKKSADKSSNQEEEEEGDWVFAVMLDDAAPLRLEQVAEVYLPYLDAEGVPLPQGEYRVRVRAFDRESALAAGASPAAATQGDPTLCSEAFSAPFPVFDALPQLLDKFFQDRQGREEMQVAGSHLVPLCATLREAGLDVPLMLEFDAGQSLDAKGQFSLGRLLSLLRGTTHHRSLADGHLTPAQLELEARCRAHWGLHHPGATAAEWAEARRAVLDHAMANERDWWLPDPLLDVKDLATGSTNSPAADFAYLSATDRYGAELCAVLSAEGSATASGGTSPAGYVQPQRRAAGAATPLHADATVDGSGALRDLTFYGAAATAPELTLETALSVAQAAIAAAQTRHSTLSLFKLAPAEKQTQAMLWCGARSLPFGGKYARTYVYAVEKAKAELAAEGLRGVATRRFEDGEVERRSEQQETDRFASATHPEQRRKQFARMTNMSGYGNEDPTPDQTSTWGQ